MAEFLSVDEYIELIDIHNRRLPQDDLYCDAERSSILRQSLLIAQELSALLQQDQYYNTDPVALYCSTEHRRYLMLGVGRFMRALAALSMYHEVSLTGIRAQLDLDDIPTASPQNLILHLFTPMYCILRSAEECVYGGVGAPLDPKALKNAILTSWRYAGKLCFSLGYRPAEVMRNDLSKLKL